MLWFSKNAPLLVLFSMAFCGFIWWEATTQVGETPLIPLGAKFFDTNKTAPNIPLKDSRIETNQYTGRSTLEPRERNLAAVNLGLSADFEGRTMGVGNVVDIGDRIDANSVASTVSNRAPVDVGEHITPDQIVISDTGRVLHVGEPISAELLEYQISENAIVDIGVRRDPLSAD